MNAEERERLFETVCANISLADTPWPGWPTPDDEHNSRVRERARRALSAPEASGIVWLAPVATREDADLLFQTYKGMLVLRTVLKKQNLRLGAERTEEILKDIETAHPEFPARSALRAAATAGAEPAGEE